MLGINCYIIPQIFEFVYVMRVSFFCVLCVLCMCVYYGVRIICVNMYLGTISRLVII